MEKFGTIKLKDTNQSYNIIWSEDGAGAERIDVIEDLRDYNLINTSNCKAAYYRKRQEKFLGDIDIIKQIFKAKSDIATLKAPMKQTIEMNTGAVVIKQSKCDDNIGIKSLVVMTNARYTSEYIETPDIIIDITDIDSNRSEVVDVINLVEYESMAIIQDADLRVTGTAEYYSLEYLKAKYPLEHMANYDFVVVESMDAAVRRLERWADADTKVKAVDLETTGFEWYMNGKDVIVGIVLSYSETESTYYPFRQENFSYNLPISFMQMILDTINSQPEDVKIIAHNGKVEKQGIWKEDVHYVGNSDFARTFDKDWKEHALHNPNLRIDGDSFLLSILVNPVFIRGAHALKTLAFKIRKEVFLELTDIFKNKKDVKFNVLPPEIVKYYACPDTANTICVWNTLIKKLPKVEMGILDLENKLLEITAINEFYGMRTRKKVLIEKRENEEYKVKMLGDLFRGIHKTSKNINSNQVRQDIFYNKLRCEVAVRTQKGAPSTSNVALQNIIEEGTLREYDESKTPPDIVDMYGKTVVKGKSLISNKYPSLVILSHYAKATKELGAFKRLERNSRKDRVYFKLNQAGAASGRQTSDAHQYSNAMKEVIVADSDHHFLWSSDFSQIELRILAYVAGQDDLIKLQSDPDIDIHRAILSIITGKPIWAISADERKKGKSTNFGVVYRMSAQGLAKKNAGPKYTKADLIAAQNSINDFYNNLPKIKKLVVDNEEFVKKNGFMMTKFGRIRPFKDILDPALSKSAAATIIRAANNTPIQGFGADYLKIAECNIQDYIKAKGWDKKVDCDGVWLPLVRIMLSIHDEVLVSSHKSIPHEEIIMMFKKCMEMQIKDAPPFFAAPAMVGNWYDGKSAKYEIDLSFRDEIINRWENGHKRILHSITYCDSFDYMKVREIDRICNELRETYLTDDLFVDGKLKVTEEFTNKCREGMADDVYEMMRKHFINPNENIKSEDIAKTVIARIMDKSFSHYLNDLTVYRATCLRDYMLGLIREFKTPEDVAAHLQHPQFTHTLIDIEIGNNEKLEHMEAIKESVKRYMENMDVNDSAVELSIEQDFAENNAIKEGIAAYEELETYVDFDENGELIVESDSEKADEDDILTIKDINTSFHDYIKRVYSTYMLDKVIIDLSDYDITDSEAERIHQKIFSLSGNDKPYTVVYFIKGKLIDTKMKIGYIPDEIDSIVTGVA